MAKRRKMGRTLLRDRNCDRQQIERELLAASDIDELEAICGPKCSICGAYAEQGCDCAQCSHCDGTGETECRWCGCGCWPKPDYPGQPRN
jgi:hypothetical protein